MQGASQSRTVETSKEREKGLLRNCLDSVRHALAHFGADNDDHGFHNRKWAILSVAHAAEAFCNLLLLRIDSEHPNGRRYPDLGRAINRLKALPSRALSKSERHAFKRLLPGLEQQRDLLMHRVPPAKLDAEQAALVLLALIYLIRRRTQIDTAELFDEASESDVFEELGFIGKDGRTASSGQDRWFEMAELMAFEDYGPQYLNHCESCYRFAKTPDRGCLACFND